MIIFKADVDSHDEIGILMQALNKAGENTRNLVTEIINSTSNLSVASREIFTTVDEFNKRMQNVNDATRQITQGTEE